MKLGYRTLYCILCAFCFLACATPKPLELEFPQAASSGSVTVTDLRPEPALFFRGEEPVTMQGSVEQYVEAKFTEGHPDLIVKLTEWSLERDGSELTARATLEAEITGASSKKGKFVGTARKLGVVLTTSDEVEVLDFAMNEAVQRLSRELN